MAHTKTEWRRMLLAARAAIPEQERRAYSAGVADRVRELPAFTTARTVLGYVAVGAEVDPASLCVAAGEDSRPIFVPGAVPGRWLRHGHEGGTAPETAVADLELPLLALVPGVGFDHSGMRLGRGTGWYDRVLRELRARRRVHLVGLAFECQVVPALPSDPWDQRVDVVVTERRILTFAPAPVPNESAGAASS